MEKVQLKRKSIIRLFQKKKFLAFKRKLLKKTSSATNTFSKTRTKNINTHNIEENLKKQTIHNKIQNAETSFIQYEFQLSKLLPTLNGKLLNIDQNDLKILPEFSEIKTIRSGNRDWVFWVRTNYTKNHFQSSNLEFLDILKASDISAWSQSISIKKAFPLTPNLFSSVGLSYHYLHTVFSHSKYLGFEDVINGTGNLERIHSRRVIYHNNYSSIGELNFGLGHTYSIRNKLDFQYQLDVNGGYQFSDEGKTFDSDLEIINKEFTDNNRFILSTTANAHIVYKIDWFKLLIGGGYSKFLTSSNSINQNILTNKPSVFFLNIGVGYQF